MEGFVAFGDVFLDRCDASVARSGVPVGGFCGLNRVVSACFRVVGACLGARRRYYRHITSFLFQGKEEGASGLVTGNFLVNHDLGTLARTSDRIQNLRPAHCAGFSV